jgi:hypothetical protein
MKKKVSHLRTDKAAELFLDRDLPGLEFSQFKCVRFTLADRAYLKSVETKLSEWNSAEDAAYDDLDR